LRQSTLYTTTTDASLFYWHSQWSIKLATIGASIIIVCVAIITLLSWLVEDAITTHSWVLYLAGRTTIISVDIVAVITLLIITVTSIVVWSIYI
jgi:hypothetical protein